MKIYNILKNLIAIKNQKQANPKVKLPYSNLRVKNRKKEAFTENQITQISQINLINLVKKNNMIFQKDFSVTT